MPKRGGGKRRKRRTHAPPPPEEVADGVPRSVVVARGRVPTGVRELVSDLRAAFSPHTAQRLRERKGSALRDYVSIASSLGVTHVWAFSATEKAPYVRLARLPQGPTLTYRIAEYTTAAHVRAAQRRPVALGASDLAGAPLLVTNNLANADAHTTLAAETLRHAFPAVDVNELRLSAVRRVLLLDRDAEDGRLRLRHYALRVQQAGLSRAVRRLVVKGRIPQRLSKCTDVAELLEDGGAGDVSSGSEGEGDDAEVELPQDIRRMRRGANSRVKLVEVGPRISMELVKIEAGVCEGEVLYHKFVTKSEEEVAADKRRVEEREAVRRKRKADQDANVRRKEEVKRARKERRKARAAARASAQAAAAGTGSEGDSKSE